MRHDPERRVTTRELPPRGPIGGPNDFGSQTIFGFPVFVVKLELDPHLDFRGRHIRGTFFAGLAVPILDVKENVVVKVLGANETVTAVFGDEHDFSQSTTLNAESLFDCVVFVGFVHNGLGIHNRYRLAIDR